MKLKEFNEELRKSTKFNINSSSNAINLDDYLIQEDYRSPFRFRRIAFSALSIVLVFVFSFYLYINDTPTTQLTIDINPTIEVGINRFDRVVDIAGTDQESINFIKDIDPSNLKIEDFMELIYQEGMSQGYFTENEAYALVGVYGDNYEKESLINSLILNYTNITFLTISQHQENNEIVIDVSDGYAPNSVFEGADNFWDGVLSEAPEDITDSDESRVSLIDLGAIQLTDLATDLDISLTKLTVVLSIYNSDLDYVSSDLSYLANLEISDLISLYNSFN
ncbi:MAG: hypothetical protein KAH13_03855 [Tenericutes bacterium]|nr:hypothetical protein [Mycoplasmatota bacterium]